LYNEVTAFWMPWHRNFIFGVQERLQVEFEDKAHSQTYFRYEIENKNKNDFIKYE